MAVSGRRNTYGLGSNEYIEVACKPCKDDGKYTSAHGLCQECDENMCSTCFRHHCKGKFCKDHVLLDLGCSDSVRKNTSASEDGLDKCQEHIKELVKFYCPGHDQVGCGDCMVFKHKACKVEYISDKATGIKESKDFKEIVKDVEHCSIQVQECLSAIQANKNKAEVLHTKFICDLEAFRDEIVKHIYKITTDMYDQATAIKTKDISTIDLIEQEAFAIKTEISSMEEMLQSHKNKSNKLFATIIKLRNELKNTKKKIVEIEKNNKTEEYVFQRNSQIKSAMADCKVLGQLQRCPDKELEKLSLDRELRNTITDADSGDPRKVTLKKASGRLGFAFTGGYDGVGIFVSSVFDDSPAGKSGRILIGDKIISINGVDTSKASYDDALTLLQQRKQTKLVLLSSCVEVTLKKKPGRLGIIITGCYGGAGIFVSKVFDDSPAGKSGRILIGDKILSINDVDTSKASHGDAVKLLQQGEQTKLVLLSSCVEVTLKKKSGRLGIVITGGYGGAGIFVSTVLDDSPAGKSGRILIGDKIISVNDVDTSKASYDDALALLQQGEQTKLVLLGSCVEEFRRFRAETSEVAETRGLELLTPPNGY